MPKFRVAIKATDYYRVEVEANDKAEAESMAFAVIKSTGICHAKISAITDPLEDIGLDHTPILQLRMSEWDFSRNTTEVE